MGQSGTQKNYISENEDMSYKKLWDKSERSDKRKVHSSSSIDEEAKKNYINK